MLSGNPKLVPPNGGWGYAVAVAVVISNVSIFSFVSSFGLLYRDTMQELGITTTGLTTITAVNAMSYAVSSYLTGPLLKVLSDRKAALLASVCLNIGVFCQVFVRSQAMFIFCQGIQSFGCGPLIIITMSAVNAYFTDKRNAIMMLTQLIPAITSVGAPIFVNWSLQYFGQRSTLLLVTGLTMQNFITAVVLQPVAWHMKKVDDSPESKAFLVNSLTTSKDSKILAKELAGAKDVVVKITINEGLEAIGSRVSISKMHVNPDDAKKGRGFVNRIGRALDWFIFKDFHLINACLGVAVAMFSDQLLVYVLPKELFNMKWDKDLISWTLSLYGFGDIAGRIILIIFSKPLTKFGCKSMFMVGLAIYTLNVIGMLWSKQQTAIIVYITAMGVSHSLLASMVPLVISELTDPAHFSSAMGVCTLIYGLVSMVLGPVIGGVRDLTKSTPTMFCILMSCFAVILLFWSIELCYISNEKKLLQRKIETELSKSTKKTKRKRTTKYTGLLFKKSTFSQNASGLK